MRAYSGVVSIRGSVQQKVFVSQCEKKNFFFMFLFNFLHTTSMQRQYNESYPAIY